MHKLTLTLNNQEMEILTTLHATGLWGVTIEATAQRILDEGLAHLQPRDDPRDKANAC